MWHSRLSTLASLPMNLTGLLREKIQSSPHGVANFTEVVMSLGRRLCSDPRDRIFGLLALIHWPEDRPTLKADYTMPASKLAGTILGYADALHRIPLALVLCDLLEISRSSPEMSMLARQRSMKPTEVQQDLVRPSAAARPARRVQAYYAISGLEIEKVPSSFERRRMRWGNGVPPNWKTIQRGSLEMLVPLSAQIGDVVAYCHSNELSDGVERAALLLRKYTEDIYEIKGHVILTKDETGVPSLFSTVTEEAIMIYASDADLFFWIWQLRSSTGSYRVAWTSYKRNPEQLKTEFCTSPLQSYAKISPLAQKALSNETVLRNKNNWPGVV